MEIVIETTVPSDLNPGKTYETTYIYIGLRRYDTVNQKIQTITRENGKFFFDEMEHTPDLFSRGYHTELVRITEYSQNPRIWREEVNDCVYLYRQIGSA